MSRELTQKLKSTESGSEDEQEEKIAKEINSSAEKDNPWVNNIKPQKEVADFVTSYRKYWEQQNKTLSAENSENIDEDKPEEPEISLNKEEGVKEVGDKQVIKKMKDKVRNKRKNYVDNVIEKPVSKKKKQQHDLSKDDNKTETSNKKKSKVSQSVEVKNSSRSKLVSTSEWQVSEEKKLKVPGDDVEAIFEKLESNLNKKIKQKLKKLTKQQDKPKKRLTKMRSKKNKTKTDLSMPSANKKQSIDEELLEQTKSIDESEDTESNNLQTKNLTNLKNIANSKSDISPNINPQKFLKVKQTPLQSAIPDILNAYEEDEAASSNQKDLIQEAFQDDDIVKDFETEKADAVSEDTPKDIEVNLPGWGQWGGTGVQAPKRKRKHLILKAPPPALRRDENKGFLIINEKAQSKIKPLLVNEIPFPFKTVKDYEASIRAPIGNTFVTETAFKKLIQPAVVTKMGSIIEPVNQSLLTGKKTVHI